VSSLPTKDEAVRQLTAVRGRQGVRAGGRDEALRDPIVDVLEAVEPGALEHAGVEQRAPIELDVGEVLEEDVVGLVVGALELLTGEGGAVLAGERS